MGLPWHGLAPWLLCVDKPSSPQAQAPQLWAREAHCASGGQTSQACVTQQQQGTSHAY